MRGLRSHFADGPIVAVSDDGIMFLQNGSQFARRSGDTFSFSDGKQGTLRDTVIFVPNNATHDVAAFWFEDDVNPLSGYASFDTGASGEEVEHARDALIAAGLSVVLDDQPYALTASGGVLEEVLHPAFIVTVASVSAFFAGFAGKAGSAAFDSLRRLVSRLRTTRAHDEGRTEVVIRGEADGPDIIIRPDTPDSAIGTLLTSPLPRSPSGALVYYLQERRWRDEKR